MHVIYMSVNAGTRTAHRTDSCGHHPQNGLAWPDRAVRLFPAAASSPAITRTREDRYANMPAQVAGVSLNTEEIGLEACSLTPAATIVANLKRRGKPRREYLAAVSPHRGARPRRLVPCLW
jgi:hypothetical protein